MKKALFLCMAMSAVLIFLPAGASAIIIDFTSPQSFYEEIVPNVDMQIGTIVWNPLSDPPLIWDRPLTWDISDGGLGIGDDEIGRRELMYFAFSGPIYISSFQIVDLFPTENEGNGETGLFFWDWANLTSFGPGDADGNLDLGINATVNNFIAFFTDGNPVNDYAVGGVSAAPVPEPGTIVLMGLGLVGLAGMGRKKLLKK